MRERRNADDGISAVGISRGDRRDRVFQPGLDDVSSIFAVDSFENAAETRCEGLGMESEKNCTTVASGVVASVQDYAPSGNVGCIEAFKDFLRHARDYRARNALPRLSKTLRTIDKYLTRSRLLDRARYVRRDRDRFRCDRAFVRASKCQFKVVLS